MVHPRTLRAVLTEARWREIEELAKRLAHTYTRDDVIEQIIFHGLRTVEALARWRESQGGKP
jgi:hypothetical protein